MTDPERDELRCIQDSWLAHSLVRHQIEIHGEDHAIGVSSWPSFRDVRLHLQPDFRDWFLSFLEDDAA
jgi:hypothetical protein